MKYVEVYKEFDDKGKVPSDSGGNVHIWIDGRYKVIECDDTGNVLSNGSFRVSYHDLDRYDIVHSDGLITKRPHLAGSLWSDLSDMIPVPEDNKCECGASKVGSNKHSDWCPKHRRSAWEID